MASYNIGLIILPFIYLTLYFSLNFIDSFEWDCILLKFASQEFMLGHDYEATLFITPSVSNALAFTKLIGFCVFFIGHSSSFVFIPIDFQMNFYVVRGTSIGCFYVIYTHVHFSGVGSITLIKSLSLR